MTPSNAVFRGVFKLCRDIYPNTTDYIDGTDEELSKLPVVYVGEVSGGDGSNKDLTGTVNQTIHLYGTLRQRQELDLIAGAIRNSMVQGIPEYGYKLMTPKITMVTLNDKSMGQTLVHTVLECKVTFYKERKRQKEEI